MQNVALLTFWKPYRRIQVDLPAEELVTDNQNCANVALQCCWASSCVLGINPYLPCFPESPKDRLSLYPFIILFFISIPNKTAWRFPSFVPSWWSFSGTSISTISLCLKQAHQAWRADSLGHLFSSPGTTMPPVNSGAAGPSSTSTQDGPAATTKKLNKPRCKFPQIK